MSKRIRYKKNDLGDLQSVQTFRLANGVVARVVIRGETYFILNSETKEEVTSGTAKNDASVKKAVKAALEDLGVEFAEETRNRPKAS